MRNEQKEKATAKTVPDETLKTGKKGGVRGGMYADLILIGLSFLGFTLIVLGMRSGEDRLLNLGYPISVTVLVISLLRLVS